MTNYREIPLTRGYKALVDESDYEWLSQYNWQARPGNNGTIYASRRGLVGEGYGTIVLMHRQVMGFPDGMDVHHKAENSTLDNRRENLEVISHSENLARRRKFKNNRSGYKGVAKHGDKWKMQIVKVFDTPEEASAAYNAAWNLLFGDI